MSPFRPDLVACWIFRLSANRELEILLIRRAPGRIYPGLWQCVTGKLDGDERIVDGALREVLEETGISDPDVEVLYSLDQVNVFHVDQIDALMSEAVFAARVGSTAVSRLSDEHDAARWLAPDEARDLVVWPAYRTAIERIEWLVAHPAQALVMRIGRWSAGDASPAG
jgi:8-oxo-dGTP pyrophosphatase MutT (NUDIX family)